MLTIVGCSPFLFLSFFYYTKRPQSTFRLHWSSFRVPCDPLKSRAESSYLSHRYSSSVRVPIWFSACWRILYSRGHYHSDSLARGLLFHNTEPPPAVTGSTTNPSKSLPPIGWISKALVAHAASPPSFHLS